MGKRHQNNKKSEQKQAKAEPQGKGVKTSSEIEKEKTNKMEIQKETEKQKEEKPKVEEMKDVKDMFLKGEEEENNELDFDDIVDYEKVVQEKSEQIDILVRKCKRIDEEINKIRSRNKFLLVFPIVIIIKIILHATGGHYFDMFLTRV